MPLTTLVRHRAVLYSSLLAVFLISLIISFTSFGNPYTDSKNDPRLQRFRVIRAKRTFYNNSGAETSNEIGYLLSTIDRNAARTLRSSFDDDLPNWRDDLMCSTHTYCGFPMYRFTEGRYLRTNSLPPSVNPTTFTLHASKRNPNNESQILVEFSLGITALTMIYVTPGNGWKYVNGSLPSSQRNWNEPFQFTKITLGKNTNEVYREWIIIVSNKFSNNIFVQSFKYLNLYRRNLK